MENSLKWQFVQLRILEKRKNEELFLNIFHEKKHDNSSQILEEVYYAL